MLLIFFVIDFVPIYEGRSVVCLQMSNTDAAMKDINEAIRIAKSAELFVNRGVIHQVINNEYSQKSQLILLFN